MSEPRSTGSEPEPSIARQVRSQARSSRTMHESSKQEAREWEACDRIVEAAIRLYRQVGYRKTTVADMAREASMSPASLYRFFASRQALEETVVGTLLDEVAAAATLAARRSGSALQRLHVVLALISQMHADRAANDPRLHELVALAAGDNWQVTLSHADRVRGVVRPLIAAGQATGELRSGSPMTLTCCLLEAMDTYLSPLRIKSISIRPTFEEMMSFCALALTSEPGLRSGTVDLRALACPGAAVQSGRPKERGRSDLE
ncbi:AcrR family transcriptional regulator [Bradyrhizobium niftali]|uniref:TetR/AcrR family transcriptional regulator n=1 Tax=Bradyrhizobium niftali TaxID=2560055 RepID=UPI003837316E